MFALPRGQSSLRDRRSAMRRLRRSFQLAAGSAVVALCASAAQATTIHIFIFTACPLSNFCYSLKNRMPRRQGALWTLFVSQQIAPSVQSLCSIPIPVPNAPLPTFGKLRFSLGFSPPSQLNLSCILSVVPPPVCQGPSPPLPLQNHYAPSCLHVKVVAV